MISALHLHNFKCFTDVKIPLGRITLLTGLNSSGKSSVIQSLLLLKQSFQAGLLQRDAIELLINGPLVELGTAADIYSDSPAEPPHLSIGLEWDSHASETWEFQYTAPDKPLRGTPPASCKRPMEHPPLGGRLHFLSAERVGPRALYALAPPQEASDMFLGQRGEYAAYHLSMFGPDPIQIPELAFKNTGEENGGRKLLTQVGHWLGVISPGIRLEGTVLTDINGVKVRFGFESSYGLDYNRRPANVGFGLSYVLPILVLLLSVPRGTLIILENPEAHLHPQGQSELGRLLARAAAQGIQLLVETHSDHVLNGLRLSVAGENPILDPNDVRLHYFARTERSGQAEHSIQSPALDRRGRLSHWPNGFFDTWEKDLDALLDF